MGSFIVENWTVFLLAFVSGLATLFGVWLGSRSKKSDSQIAFGTSFAAGIMVLVSLLELIPGAYAAIQFTSLLWVIAGVAIVWGINKIIPHLHYVKAIENCNAQCMVKMSYLLAIGLILHDFPEGFAIPSSFEAARDLGFLLVLAIFIHNIPEGYVLTVVSTRDKSSNFYYKSAFMSAISTFAGAVFGVILIHWFNFLNPVFLSLVAGAMLFISFHELIPTSVKISRNSAMVSGVSTAVVLYWTVS